jgi:hypothetical protein
VRFRHPEEKQMKRVTVNGKEIPPTPLFQRGERGDFDAEKELIYLHQLDGETEVVAFYQ